MAEFGTPEHVVSVLAVDAATARGSKAELASLTWSVAVNGFGLDEADVWRLVLLALDTYNAELTDQEGD